MQRQTGFSRTARTYILVAAVAVGSYFFSRMTPVLDSQLSSCISDHRVSLVIGNSGRVMDILHRVFPVREELLTVNIAFTVEHGRLSRVSAYATPYPGARFLNRLEKELFDSFKDTKFAETSGCIEVTREYVLYQSPSVPPKTNVYDLDMGPMFAINLSK